jgi:adenylyltransferase/sulfurtransferase
MSQPVLEVTPQDVKRRLDAGEPVVLLDVREPGEYALARIDGSQLIPMNTIPAQLSTVEGLAEGSLLVTVCHHGMRSLNVAAWLQGQGVSNCVSMTGGIDRWSLEIDPTVPRY